VQDIYSSGAGVDIPVIPELPKTSVTYMIPLDHFNSMTCYLFCGFKHTVHWSYLNHPSSCGPFYNGPKHYDYSHWEYGGYPSSHRYTTFIYTYPISSSSVPCFKYFHPHSYPSSVWSFWNFYPSWIQCCCRFHSDTFPGPLRRVLSTIYGRIWPKWLQSYWRL
jgi:hypothetical protein